MTRILSLTILLCLALQCRKWTEKTSQPIEGDDKKNELQALPTGGPAVPIITPPPTTEEPEPDEVIVSVLSMKEPENAWFKNCVSFTEKAPSDTKEHDGADYGEFRFKNTSQPQFKILWFYFKISKNLPLR